MSYLYTKENNVILSIRVTPNAKKTAIVGLWNKSHLKITLNAPPTDGRANEVLISFLSKILSVNKSDISIICGQTAREKKIQIRGLNITNIRQKITF